MSQLAFNFPEQHAPRPKAKRRSKLQIEYEQLKQDILSAEGDLSDCTYNLDMVEMHQAASREGKIDANWWQGAFQMGIWHAEESVEYREGSYPIKVVRWLRHLRFTLCLEQHNIMAYLDQKKAAFKSLQEQYGQTLEAA